MPDELDPQVREFAGQLRRVVDRSGLSIAAVADRTGYSKTSWERYLNGRLLAPKGAIVALAEVTGTNPVHLTTMWELAERAWSRSEMRHDMTMEAIRISQARAALGETGSQPSASAPAAAKGRTGKAGRGTAARPGVAGPAGVAPTVPPSVPSQAPPPGEEQRPYGDSSFPSPSPLSPPSPPSPSSPSSYAGRGGTAQGTGAEPGAGTGVGGGAGAGAGAGAGHPRGGSWGVAHSSSDPTGPSRAQGAGAHRSASGPGGGTEGPIGAFGPAGTPEDARPGGSGASEDARSKRRLTMFLAGVGGALVVIAAAFFLTGGEEGTAGDRPTAPVSSDGPNPDLPAGVKCGGEECTGKDAEAMGCSGDLVETTDSVKVGTALVEVRYSRTCDAAWARITAAAQGDEVRVSVGGAEQTGAIEAAGDTTAYTPMVAVKDAGDATACASLKAGQEGCTK
ncbi:hypothetical protein GCM10010365_08510 [Streptomyces poonensis]|uniref:HTH cro/C1-type domain-containing protein n=1 Tax=Streptomyces poonensis TaxID=68255 RepID=A0A918P8M9_9ACTN|nr:XRE family transcriptional regulator [Streptomyces poonensis]GGY92320.1 hypothetical protein GCM10010365_08510 [Streptomyces poonensis]